jgi:uncharacterized membrane protein YgcG
VRAEAAHADRNASVRRAARGWRRAGAIDDVTFAAIEADLPDDRVRVGPVFRVLLFVFTLVAIGASFGFVVLLAGQNEKSFAVLAGFWGIALAILTEVQTGRFRRAQGGTEAATSFASLGLLLASLGWLLFEGLDLRRGVDFQALFLGGAVFGVAAAWRWGFPLYAGAATASLLLALAYLPGARLLWVVLPLLAAPFLLRLADSERLPPAHRASATAALVVALAALYVAIHLGSLDGRLIEALAHWTASRPATASTVPSPVRWLSIAATVLVPIALLAFGIRGRRRPLLLLGLATGAVSVATFHDYVHPFPLWTFLTVCGLIAIGAALATRRFLDCGPDRERAGLTAEPLFEDLERQRGLEAAAAVVTLSPEARAPAEGAGFEGGGGEFGGGGSSGTW